MKIGSQLLHLQLLFLTMTKKEDGKQQELEEMPDC
jgi:hypothetical protein